ncbi:MAG: 5'-nucleotidase C-terminal domain-containing protein, partial [bacterium]
RTLLKLIGFAATGSLLPKSAEVLIEQARAESLDTLYQLPMKGNARILHTTDIHAQLLPVYYREPNVNLGVGPAQGMLPHLVGKALLEKAGFDEGSIEAYAYTNLDFEANARKYGRMGGFAYIKTLLDSLRTQAGDRDNTLTLDGGDLWQGSATALWTRGTDMVDASNLLGVDIMTGHWEFTYHEAELLANVKRFNGEFLSQNVRVKEDSLFGDEYYAMVEQFDGLGLYDEDAGLAFKPYSMRNIGGRKIAVIGQAFPRTANANPQGFIPDWSFGIREDELIELVAEIKDAEAPDATIMLSHNGMDVDLKLASRVSGIDAIFGGHTHDGIPVPVEVETPEGKVCMVTNAGTNGKFVGMMDLDIGDGEVKGMQYHLVPVFENLLDPDPEMSEFVAQMRASVYQESIVESRAEPFLFNQNRVGKTYQAILEEKLAIADRALYRRGNFMGTWDQLICDAMKHEYDAEVTLSPGFRWGTSVLSGEWITMEDVMTQTAMTYGETYIQEMTGEALLTILESVADNLFDPDPYFQSGGDMVRVGGLDYTIDPSKPLLQRISDVVLDSGESLDTAKTYQVAGWAVVGPHPDGRLIWDVVRDYLIGQRNDKNVIEIPKMNHPTLVGVADNPGVADYDGKIV